jgi:hypothetical protein
MSKSRKVCLHAMGYVCAQMALSVIAVFAILPSGWH